MRHAGASRPGRAARCSPPGGSAPTTHLTLVGAGHRRADPARALRGAGGRRRRRPRMLLRRAFSIYKVSAAGVYGGTVEIVFAVARRRAPRGWPRRAPHDAGRRRRPARPAVRRCPSEPVACVAGRRRLRLARRCSRSPTRCASAAAGSTSCSARRARTGSSASLEAKRDRADASTVTTDDGSVGHARPGHRRAARRARPHRRRRGLRAAARWRCCARSPRSRPARGAARRCAVEESMACGIGVCMTCVLPVVGDDGVTRMAALLRRGPGVPRRPGALGRRRHASRTTPSAPRGAEATDDAPHASRTVDRAERAPTTPRRRPDAPRSAALELPNPVLTASGCAAAGRELDQFFDVAELGAVVTKSIMPDPRSGRPTPRMAETPSGMLNSIGLQGPGHRRLPRPRPAVAARARRPRRRVDRRRQRRRVRRAGRAGCAATPRRWPAIEVNISCPNVENRGLVFACDPRRRAGGRRAGAPSSRRATSRSSPSSRPTSPTSSRSPRRASTPAPTACR